jgi:hypothetical protein
MAGQSAILAIKIIADASNAAKGLDDTSSAASRMGAGFKSAAIPAAALAAGLAVMAKGAAEDAQAQAVLANQLQNTAGATAAQVAAVEEFISKTAMATGVADDQLRPAMAALARGTGDVTQAQKAMNVALDVAAATGKPVEAVADAIAKGYGGSTTALAKLVPGMDKAVTATGDMNVVMAELARMTGGASAAAADTAAGRMQRLTVAMDETKESVGAALLPALQAVLPMFEKAATFVQRNAEVVGPLIVVLGVLAVSIWAVNAAMLANPVTWIVIAIAAFIAIIIVAYQKCDTFRNIVQAAFRFIIASIQFWWDVVKVIFGFVIDYYQMLWRGAQVMAGLVVAAWDALKSGVSAAWSWVRSHVIDPFVAAFQLAIEWGNRLRSAVTEAWSAVASAISSAWATIRGIFDSFLDKIKSVIEWLGKVAVPDWLRGAVSSVVGGQAVIAPAPAIPGQRGRAAPASTTAARAGRSALNLQVDVYLDGQRMRGYVDRVVVGHLEAEGATLAAGGWGPR